MLVRELPSGQSNYALSTVVAFEGTITLLVLSYKIANW